MDPDSSRLRVSVSDGTGRAVPDGGLSRWLARLAPPRAAGEVAIALVSDARMRTLNRTYRRRDVPTDVLSFPADRPASAYALRASARSRRGLGEGGTARQARAAGARDAELGDIVIATGVARRQAKAAGHSYQSELRVLALHGLLHLLGYDHHGVKDNGRMARVERALRRKGGLETGLIERAPTPAGTRRASA